MSVWRAKERDAFEKELDLLSSLLRDLLLLSSGSPRQKITNVDVADQLERIASKAGLKQVTEWSEKFNQVRRRLRININRQIAMEEALLSLAKDHTKFAANDN